MARETKLVANIAINESDLKVSDVLKMGASAPITQIAAAKAIVDDRIGTLKALSESCDKLLKGKTYSEAIDDLVDKKILPDADYRPIITVKTNYGNTITLAVTQRNESGFEISDDIKDKSVMDSIVPDKYKKVQVVLDKKAIENDFDNGTLPALLKGYCSKAPREAVMIRKSVKPTGK